MDSALYLKDDKSIAQLVPVIAYVGLFDKQNYPVLTRNYLVEYLQQNCQIQKDSSQLAVQPPTGNPDDTQNKEPPSPSSILSVPFYSASELEDLKMQMSMIVFSTFDTFEDKQKVVPGFDKTQEGTNLNLQTESSQIKTFQGLLMESFVSHYELDCYGFLSPTNIKIVVLKNETKTNSAGMKPAEITLLSLFRQIHKEYSMMILNPFYQNDIAYSSNTFNAVPKASLTFQDEEDSDYDQNFTEDVGDSGVSDSSSCSSNLVQQKEDEKFSAKRNNKECLKQLKQRIDKKVQEIDRKLKDIF